MLPSIKHRVALFQAFMVLTLLAAAIFPPVGTARAQDETPPAPESAPAETLDGAAASAEPDPGTAELPPEQTVEAPAEPEAVFPVEQTVEAPSEATEAALPVEMTVEAPAAAAASELAPAGEEAAESEEAEAPASAEDLAAIVSVMEETNTVLLDENDEVIPLASAEAAEALVGADPFFELPGGGFAGYTSGAGCPTFVTECHTGLANPLGEALSDPRLAPHATLYIEGDTSSSTGKLYNETVTFNQDVSLQAGTGFTYVGGAVGYSEAVATIQKVILRSDLSLPVDAGTGAYSGNVFANNIYVDGTAAIDDNSRGDMLDDALAMVNPNGTVTLSSGTFADTADGFEVENDGVTIAGQGVTTILKGSAASGGHAIKITGDLTNLRSLKIVDSYYGVEIGAPNQTLTLITLEGNQGGINVKPLNSTNFDFIDTNVIGTEQVFIHFEEYEGEDQIIYLTLTRLFWNGVRYYFNFNKDRYDSGFCEANPLGICYERRPTGYSYSIYNYFPTVPCSDLEQFNSGTGRCERKPETYCSPGDHYSQAARGCVSSGCAAGLTDWDSDGRCESSQCANGYTDRNNDGMCETSSCGSGFTDTNNDGLCEPSGCIAGRNDDPDNDGICEPDVCPATTNNADSDAVCEPDACSPGSNNVDSDDDCDATLCSGGSFDANSDGKCEVTQCASDASDDDNDGVCEPDSCSPGTNNLDSDDDCDATLCTGGSFDVDSDGYCEVTRCTSDAGDDDNDGVCEPDVCPTGSNNADSDSVCEPDDCPNGFNNTNSDDMCESSNCPAGQTDYLNNGTCVKSNCRAGEQDLDSDGVCSPSTCPNGSYAPAFDNVCASSGCQPGSTDFDNDGKCESSGCLPGTNDIDSDGACAATVCSTGSFDRNSDGVCEPTICGPGTFDKNADGTCKPTVCTGGQYDTDSDGLCEDVGFTPDQTTGAYTVLGAAAVIPVTGGVNELSCTEANTLVLPSGASVSFSAPLCGYAAVLNEESGVSLPTTLPDGLTFLAGLSFSLQKDNAAAIALPDPVTSSLTFPIPMESIGKTLVLLHWDPSANGGLGAWSEIAMTEPGMTSTEMTGTFILAYR